MYHLIGKIEILIFGFKVFGSGFEKYKRPCMVREEEGRPVDGTLWIVVPLESRFK